MRHASVFRSSRISAIHLSARTGSMPPPVSCKRPATSKLDQASGSPVCFVRLFDGAAGDFFLRNLPARGQPFEAQGRRFVQGECRAVRIMVGIPSFIPLLFTASRKSGRKDDLARGGWRIFVQLVRRAGKILAGDVDCGEWRSSPPDRRSCRTPPSSCGCQLRSRPKCFIVASSTSSGRVPLASRVL